MAGYVLDCTVSLAWAFEDRCDHRIDGLLAAVADEGAAVPTVWTLQMGQSLLEAESRGLLTAADSRRFMRLLSSLPIEVDRETPARAFTDAVALARLHGISVYQAAYLELAAREGLPLATLDPQLIQAARQVGVGLR